MSKMIPQRTVDVLRLFNDVSVELYGIDCELYVPKNLDLVEIKDVFSYSSDYEYDKYDAKVFIEWSPNQHRLRKLGIFMEGETPIVAWFKNQPEVTIRSYIKIPLQYIPSKFDTDEFEIVDLIVPYLHDMEILRSYKIAPRRIKKL